MDTIFDLWARVNPSQEQICYFIMGMEVVVAVLASCLLCKKANRERDEAVQEKTEAEKRANEARDERLNLQAKSIRLREIKIDSENRKFELEGINGKLTYELEKLKKRKVELKLKYDELSKQLKVEKKDNRELKEEVDSLKEEIKKLEEEINLKKQIIFGIAGMLASWTQTKEIKSLKAKIHELRRLIEARFKCGVSNDVAMIREMRAILVGQVQAIEAEAQQATLAGNTPAHQLTFEDE